MNIVKQFEDPIYSSRLFSKNTRHNWYWGLGDDGQLYCKEDFGKNYDENEEIVQWTLYHEACKYFRLNVLLRFL